MPDRFFSLSSAPTCQGGVFTSCISAPRVQFMLLLVLSLFLCTIKLDSGGLAAYDECFYAQKAKEMVHSGDWLTQTYAGRACHQNPWLHMWIIAASYRVFGISEWSARLPTALQTVVIVLLTFLLVQWLGAGPWLGLLASSFLLLSDFFFKYARKAHMDHLMALLFLVAMLAYIAGRKRHQAWFLVLGLATGLGILTKSVLGLMPAVVVLAHIVIGREWRLFSKPLPWLSALLALVVGCSWYVYEYVHFGDEFVRVHFGTQLLARFALGGVSADGISLGGFVLGRLRHVYAFMLDAHIWFLMALLGAGLLLFRRREADLWPAARAGERLLLVLWFILPVLVISFADTFKGWYLMPTFVPMAILSAFFVGRVIRDPRRVRTACCVVLALLVLHLGILTVTPLFSLDQAHELRHPGLRKLATQVRALGPEVSERVIYFPASEEIAARHGIRGPFGYYFSFANPWIFYSDRPLVSRHLRPDLEAVRSYLASGAAVCLTTYEGFRVISEDGALPFAIIGRASERGIDYVVCCSSENYAAWRGIIETDHSRAPLYSLRDY